MSNLFLFPLDLFITCVAIHKSQPLLNSIHVKKLIKPESYTLISRAINAIIKHGELEMGDVFCVVIAGRLQGRV